MEKKEEAIINSSFKEFSRYGFDKTSISDIYRTAKISKGLVYYYFRDKKDLYLKSLIYAISKVTSEIDKYDFSSLDFLSRIANITVVKLEFFLKHSDLMNFLESSSKESSSEVLSDVQKILKENYVNNIKKIEEMINYDSIEVGIEKSKIIDIINFTFSGAYKKASMLENEIDRKNLIYSYKDILIKLLYRKR